VPSWPATLPQKQFLGTTFNPQDNVLRTDMETGPPSRRKRFTAIYTDVDVPLLLTGAQVQTLETFYNTTLESGALEFDWEHPITDATVSYSFRSPPTYDLIGGGTPDTRTYATTLRLRIEP